MVTRQTTITEITTATIIPLVKTWPGMSTMSSRKKKKMGKISQGNFIRIFLHHIAVVSFFYL